MSVRDLLPAGFLEWLPRLIANRDRLREQHAQIQIELMVLDSVISAMEFAKDVVDGEVAQGGLEPPTSSL
jgi:hypothetical protein